MPGVAQAAVDILRSFWQRYRFALAFSGAALCVGQLLWWFSLGAWPLHDTAAFWLAGTHFREGTAVYAGDVNFLTMLYAPPWVVLMGAVSLLPFAIVEIGLLAGQVLALRYVAGSWLVAMSLGWVPFVPRELAAGNLDLMIAAAILIAIEGGPSVPVALFAFAKFSPGIAILAPRARWREAAAATLVLVAVTLPWSHLWPQWIDGLGRAAQQVQSVLPLVPRLAIAVPLTLLHRPWTLALAAAIAVPGFYFHSAVLFLPAVRLWWLERTRREAEVRHRPAGRRALELTKSLGSGGVP